jgi:tripartite motif-containing protein 71
MILMGMYVTDMNNHRIQKFDSQGNFISMWGSEGEADGQFAWLESVDTDSRDNVYVVEVDNERVQKFTSDGQFISKWGTGGEANGQFRKPAGIAIDASDNVYLLIKTMVASKSSQVMVNL